ncbi:protein polyglycylase TTLL10 isoform X2 [Lepisosteus oculatus]|uniref:protein polyglycylase TTLL10 isoform X2 n=1 Tax=Lepisosteus oculatus TaxID=7918 RepID=UPI00371E0436
MKEANFLQMQVLNVSTHSLVWKIILIEGALCCSCHACGLWRCVPVKRQIHDIVHVEIWLGDGEGTLGARWRRGTVQVFDSYKFTSSSYGHVKYHFKSIETWLSGSCISHCKDHKWGFPREMPCGKSIFYCEDMAKQEGAPQGPLSEQGHTEPQPVTASGGDRQHTAGEQECTGTAGPPVPPGTGSELPGGPSTPETGELPSGRQWSPRAHPPARSRPGARPSREVKRDVQLPQQQEEKQDGHRASRERPAVKEEGGPGVPVSCRDSEGLDRGEQGSSTASIPKPCHCDASHQHSDTEQRLGDPRGTGPFYYIGGGNGVAIVRAYCEGRGWQRVCDKTREDYTLRWCETKSHSAYCRFREGEQLLYQVPNNKVLTTKIGLLSSLREYERVASKVKPGRGHRRLKMEEFFPDTFRMDVREEKEAFFTQQEAGQAWICKPTGLNQGRGIFLLRTQEEINAFQAKLQSIEDSQQHRATPFRCPQARIVQRYIQSPLLLEGRKFDVRSYFLIACLTPYMVFFRHGYVRLTCDPYDPSSDDLSAHLTNQYMQKKNPLYNEVKEETVWSMERFNDYVNEKFRAVRALPQDWVLSVFTKRMQQIMTQCFLAVRPKLERKLGYFDLIGCDFMIDEDFKVWLLEMNCNPALHTNCQVLKEVVPSVVNETLDLTIEIFNKCRKKQSLAPLETLRNFVLLYNGEDHDLQAKPQRSKTAVAALPAAGRTPRPQAKAPAALPLPRAPAEKRQKEVAGGRSPERTGSRVASVSQTPQKAPQGRAPDNGQVSSPAKTGNRVELKLNKCGWPSQSPEPEPRRSFWKMKSTIASLSTPTLSEKAYSPTRSTRHLGLISHPVTKHSLSTQCPGPGPIRAAGLQPRAPAVKLFHADEAIGLAPHRSEVRLSKVKGKGTASAEQGRDEPEMVTTNRGA